jgi:predicted RNase H-like HicB family nuclease
MLNKKIGIAIEEGGPDQAFGVIFPDIEGCFSAGDTLDEAIENAQEAVEGYLEVLLEDGDELPNFKSIQEHRANPEYDGFIWSFVSVDMTPFMGKSKKVNVTLPELLLRQIDNIAATSSIYKTRSGFLAKAAMHELKLSV